MSTYKDYLELHKENVNISKLKDIIEWVSTVYPDIKIEIKWNQPMLVWNNTFIAGFSLAKNHITVAFEKVVFNNYLEDLKKQFAVNKGTYKVQKSDTFDTGLLKKMIDETMALKVGTDKFWL